MNPSRGDAWNVESAGGNLERASYTNVPLPPRQPLASPEAECALRLFIVSKPGAFHAEVLKDLFCRFGNLIKAYWQKGWWRPVNGLNIDFITGFSLTAERHFGYALYASEQSARNAMLAMHMQVVCGMTLKVIEAEPMRHNGAAGDEPDNKRSKNDF